MWSAEVRQQEEKTMEMKEHPYDGTDGYGYQPLPKPNAKEPIPPGAE
jgi:hypothetical protein